MTAEVELIESRADSVLPDGAMRTHLGALFAILAVILVAYFETFRSLVDVWSSTDTFRHGFIIFPISAYLVWRKWPALKQARAKPFFPGALALILLSMAWFVSDFLGIQVGTHFAIVALIPMAIVTVMGLQFSRVIAFPLAYLIFAVPFGEALIPYLVEYTATFTVEALNVTGIPVIRDGRFFSTPAGNFEVAKACSGIRYLLATLSLGTLFSYFNFQSIGKRTIFIVVSLIVPIIANGFRAYGIVLLAHYSDMRIAVGFDHIIYGWIFFGVVIAVLFLLGGHFRDAEVGTDAPHGGNVEGSFPEGGNTRRRALLIVPLALVCANIGPVLQVVPHVNGKDGLSSSTKLPSNIHGWPANNSYNAEYKPRYSGSSDQLFAQYGVNDSIVNLAIVQYRDFRQGAELANSENTVVDASFGWKLGNVEYMALILPGQSAFRVREVLVTRPGSAALVWYWYSVNGRPTESYFGIKLREAQAFLFEQESVSSATIIVAPVSVDISTSRFLLRSFVSASYESIKECLASKDRQPACKHGISRLDIY